MRCVTDKIPQYELKMTHYIYIQEKREKHDDVKSGSTERKTALKIKMKEMKQVI